MTGTHVIPGTKPDRFGFISGICRDRRRASCGQLATTGGGGQFGRIKLAVVVAIELVEQVCGFAEFVLAQLAVAVRVELWRNNKP